MNIQILLKKFYFLIAFGMFIVLMVNCSHTNNVDSGFDTVYKEAQAAKKSAEAGGNIWRDSNKILKNSLKAAEAGMVEKAINLANTAKAEYEMALQQIQSNEQYLKTATFYDPNATPEEDIKTIQAFFRDKFPKLPDIEFANGFYALDDTMRVNWVAIEEFAPYEPAIEEGEALWNTAFKNGRTYADCFNDARVASQFPRWDKKTGEVETLPLAINKCRKANGEKPLKYGKHDILSLQAYVSFMSRGALTYVKVPADDPAAIAAYQNGKKIYFSRRGQLNMSCFHCHFHNSGSKIRANTLGPAMGQTTHWPTYRSKWGSMGSLHRRYKGCNKQIRAKPFGLQSKEYRNLEFFHTFLSNGIPTNGPGARF